MIRKIGSVLLRVGISLASLSLVMFAVRGKFMDALGYLMAMDPLPATGALGIHMTTLFIVSYRLQLVLAVQGVRLGMWRLYYLWLISMFFNLFLPSAVGGDIGKAYYIYKDCNDKVVAATSVLVDRFLGLMATITMATIAFLIARQQMSIPSVGPALLIIVVITLSALLLVMSQRFSEPVIRGLVKISPKRIKAKVQQMLEALTIYRNHRWSFFVAYLYSMSAQALFIFIFYLLARSLGIELHPGIFYLLIPIVTICSMIPSIGGLGVREASTVYLFQRFIPVEEAAALSIIAAVFIYGFGAACGILYAFRGGASIQELERVEEPNGA